MARNISAKGSMNNRYSGKRAAGAGRPGTRTSTTFDAGVGPSTGSSTAPGTGKKDSSTKGGVSSFDDIDIELNPVSDRSKVEVSTDPSIDPFGDAAADAAMNDVDQPEPGMSSFDFALDNLSGVYGDLDL